MAERHNVVREGVLAGVIGASVIAVWFFIVDIVAGRPFYTPQILGEGVRSVFGPAVLGDTMVGHIASYTVLHYLVFIILGIILTAVVHQAERTPSVLAGLLILFVAFELGFYGLTALLTESPLGNLAWYQIGLANLLAAGAMFAFMWKRHPALGRELNEALSGEDDH